jgi:DNA adenine methylase Dam
MQSDARAMPRSRNKATEQSKQMALVTGYGEQLLRRLARDLSKRFGRGFSERNLEQMRGFYLRWPNPQTLSTRSLPAVDRRVRAQAPKSLSQIERAARFIFLNKTCFDGLYRVNRRGHFNVPYGRNIRANFTDEGALRRVSQCLEGAELRCGDFADICADAAEGDFVYFDPPYITRRAARVIRYQPGGFREADHRRLARYVRELDMRGCFVMVSNSEHPLVLKLYQGFHIDSLDVRRKVNADAAARGGWRELLIRNFDQRGNLLTRRRIRSPQLCLPWR